MNQDRFDELMTGMAREYHVPPEPRLELMWNRIERARRTRAAWWRRGTGMRPRTLMAFAATLLLGVALGRYSAPEGAAPDTAAVVIQAPESPAAGGGPQGVDASDVAAPYRMATGQLLGRTVTLLTALPREQRGVPDQAFLGNAAELLSMTRLLLDSPAADDPELRALLGDMELVLAQVSGLAVRQGQQEVQLITDALDSRDVLPRLRLAVAQLPGRTDF